MRIKLDENLLTSLVPMLSGLGHDVHHVVDEGLRGQPDPVVAAAAKRASRVLFTFADVRKYPPGAHPGIVLLRSAIPGAPAISQLVLGLLASITESELLSAVTIVEQGRLRVRRPG